jgi:hypothetical protein
MSPTIRNHQNEEKYRRKGRKKERSIDLAITGKNKLIRVARINTKCLSQPTNMLFKPGDNVTLFFSFFLMAGFYQPVSSPTASTSHRNNL